MVEKQTIPRPGGTSPKAAETAIKFFTNKLNNCYNLTLQVTLHLEINCIIFITICITRNNPNRPHQGISCIFWTVCPTDLCLIFLEMAENSQKAVETCLQCPTRSAGPAGKNRWQSLAHLLNFFSSNLGTLKTASKASFADAFSRDILSKALTGANKRLTSGLDHEALSHLEIEWQLALKLSRLINLISWLKS